MKKIFFLFIFLVLSYCAIAQNVGIGITNPKARLHVIDSNVVFSAAGFTPVSAGNPPLSGIGRRMFWYPDKAAFRAGFVVGTNWDKDSVGLYSVAMGYDTRATANASTAIGFSTIAGGYGSNLATGTFTLAYGYCSSVMGYGSMAMGQISTAIGDSIIGRAMSSLSIGSFNDISDHPTPSAYAPSDRVFQIGNGTAGSRSNAFTILRNARTGIGTVNPLARLHVADSSVVFSANGDIVNPVGNPPISGAGRRMMWYADNASFRVGYVDGTQWDQANLGNYSFASGYNTIANGFWSTATGFMSSASGTVATALGNDTHATGHSATAIGHGTFSTGLSSTSMGFQTNANGDFSTAMGEGTTARAYSSTAMGLGTKAKAYGSLSIGINNDTTDNPNLTVSALTDRIFQIGNGDITGTRSNALTVLRNGNTGIGRTVPDFPLSFSDSLGTKISLYGSSAYNYGLGIQAFKLQIYTPDPNGDILFGFGSSSSLTETMRIKGNGNVGIGTNAPSSKLEVCGNTRIIGTLNVSGTISSSTNITCPSDIRYKKDLVSFDHPLNSLLSLKGFYYHWKKDEFPAMQFNDKRQIGFSAQEVEKLFPELVMTDARGYKSVDYGRLTPVLVEAIREQQQQINHQQQEIDELKTMIEKLISK